MDANQPEETLGGWAVGPSIASELDLALNVVRGGFMIGGMPEDVARMVQSIPPDQQRELDDLLGRSKAASSVLESAAYLAGALFTDDYAQATLAIRELTAAEALERIRETAAKAGLTPDESLPTSERLVSLASRMVLDAYRQAGLSVDEIEPRTIRTFQLGVRILKDGDLNARFWHWLDRFYYETYRPWRALRSASLEAQKNRAVTVLGGTSGSGLPDLSWLPPQNPLLIFPGLSQAVQRLGCKLYFWVEPFGMADSTALFPGLVIVSFAEPGVIYENFRAYAADVAGRAAALADPTRLIILRIIRHFGMFNTEIASYLGISRPTVSIHAKILREAGLIRSLPEGRLVRHELAPAEVRRLFSDLEDLERFLDLPEDENRE